MTNESVWPISIWQRFAIGLDVERPGYVCGANYTLTAVIRLHGPLDAGLLDAAFAQLTARHDLLRTRIERTDRGAVQVVSARVDNQLEVLEQVRDFSLATFADAPVEFGARSPIRLRLAAETSGDHLLAVHLHHVMADPTTLWTVVRELGLLYSRLADGGVLPALSRPSAQYGQYAEMETRLAAEERIDNERWWRNLLPSKSSARTLRNHHRDGQEGACRRELLTAGDLARLERWTRKHRNVLFATLTAAMACGIAPRYVTTGGLLFTTLFSRRDRPEWQLMLGPCTVPGYLWLPEPPERLSPSYAAAVRDALLGCYRHARHLDVETLIGLCRQDPVHGAYSAPFFEYLPKAWPERVRFGGAVGVVVNSVGPRDNGFRRGLGLRARKTRDGALTGRLSWDGNGWTEELAMAVCDDLRGVIGEFIGDEVIGETTGA